MANIKSQKKRILTNEKARLRNNSYKSELKTLIRKVDAAVESGNKDAAAETLRTASRKLDKAVSKGVLHKNTAANKKSGLAKKVSKIIREQGPKSVKSQIQGDELRVQSKSRDDLQATMALLKKADLDVDLQFVNFR